MNGVARGSVDAHKDLALQVRGSLKAAAEIDVLKKVLGILAFLGWATGSKTREVMAGVYKLLITPQMEQCAFLLTL